MSKIFVIDTNVFLSNCGCIENFAKNDDVVIPYKVLDEIDNHKERQDSVGANARGAIRKFDKLRKQGELSKGVKPEGCGGKVSVLGFDDVLPDDFDMSDEDNQIIAVAKTLQESSKNVKVISRDLNLRVKCNSLGIDSEDYTDIKAVNDTSSLYDGYKIEEVSKEIIDKGYNAITEGIKQNDFESNLKPNEFISLRSVEGGQSSLFRKTSSGLKSIKPNEYNNVWKTGARNLEQIFSFDLLLDDDISIVTLVGRAGTGKTLCSLCAGLNKVMNKEEYKKIVIIKPVEPVGRDLGYLPGSMEEKIHPWLKPFKDQLEEIYGDRMMLDEHIERGKVEIQPLSYIRGRTINDAYILFDESQNCSLHETKTVLTRVGNGSKIVMTGDIRQIDNAYVDETSNGLTHAVEAFKNDKIAGHCTLRTGERSKVASVAAEAL